jgi:peptide/nickel transport system substrate-binding protein
MRRRTLVTGALAGAGVMLARHGRANAKKPTYGGRLRTAFSLAPSALDPATGRSGDDAHFWRQYCDSLIDVDAQMRPRPERSLAESWDFSDPSALVFRLRKGVTFHDGTAFNAEAVKFNVDRMMDPASKATARSLYTAIDTTEVMDEHTVRVRLNKRFGSVLGVLSDRGGAMNSPTAVRALGLDYGFKPASTGPFKVAEYVSGSYLRLVRNENYWGRDEAGNPLPYLDEIVMNVIPDVTMQLAALRAGELDVAYVPYREVPSFLNNSRYAVTPCEGSSVALLLSFNMAKPPLDNPHLRLAIAHAVNPDALNRAVFFNRALIAKGGMWPPGTLGYDPSVERPGYNVARAREHLRLGGMPGGFEIDAILWPSEFNTPAVEIIRAQLGAIGIRLNLQVHEMTVATEKFYDGNEAHLSLTTWPHQPEPAITATNLYHSGGSSNAGKLRDAKMDALVDEGAATIDPEKRRAIYRKIDEIVLGEAWVTPLIYGVTYAAAHRHVMGMEEVFSYDARMYLHRMWLKKG